MSTIEASLKLEIAQYQAALARAQGDIRKFREGAKKQGGMLSNDLFGGLKSGLAGLGAGVSLGAVKSLLVGMDDLADAALKLNESTETLQRVEYASKKLASVDMNGVSTSFLRLEKALGDVENKAANQALARYGITAAELARQPLDQKILMFADAFQKARADGTGYNDLLALLGKSAGDLIPLFEQSGDAIRQAFNEAPVVIDATVQRMADLNDKVDGLFARSKAGFGSMLDYIALSGRALGGFFSGRLGEEQKRLQKIQDDFEKENDPAKKKALFKQYQAALKGTFWEEVAGEDQSAEKTADILRKKEQQAQALEQAAEIKEMGPHEATPAQKKTMSEAAAAADAAIRAQKKALSEEASLREQIAEIQRQTYLESLPANERSLVIAREIAQLERSFAEAGPETETARLEMEKRILELKKEQASADKEAAHSSNEDEKRAAAQAESLEIFRQELAIIEARAAGENDLADSMQRQLDIQQLQARLMEEMNLSEAEALALAERHVDAQAAINAEKSKGSSSGRYDADGRRSDGRKKIQGYSRERQGGAEAAAARAQNRIDDARAKREIPSGLDAFAAQPGLRDRMAGGGMFPGLEGAFGPAGTHEASPMTDTAAMNAAAADRQPGDAARGLEDKLDRLIAISEQGLLGE